MVGTAVDKVEQPPSYTTCSAYGYTGAPVDVANAAGNAVANAVFFTYGAVDSCDCAHVASPVSGVVLTAAPVQSGVVYVVW